jgi:hypothetical protein
VYLKAKNDTIAQNEKLNINTISKSVIVFTDLFAEPGVQYTYLIVAFDTSGNYSEFSDVYQAVLLNKNKNEFALSNFLIPLLSNQANKVPLIRLDIQSPHFWLHHFEKINCL